MLCRAEPHKIWLVRCGTGRRDFIKPIFHLVRRSLTESSRTAGVARLGRPSATYKTNSHAAPCLKIVTHAYIKATNAIHVRNFKMADDKSNLYDLSLSFAFGKPGKRANTHEGDFDGDGVSNGEDLSTPFIKKQKKSAQENTGACWPRILGLSEMESDQSEAECQSQSINGSTLSGTDTEDDQSLEAKLPSKKGGKQKGAKNSAKGETLRWTEEMITDMVDLIANTATLRKYLIFENNKNASNGKHYETLVKGLNTRIAAYEPPDPVISASQARNKFKKLVSECKNVSLTIKTASGIDRHKVEKGYGRWWDILFKLISSRPSSDPSNTIEPTFEEVEEDAGPLQIDSATQTPPKAKKFVPKRPSGSNGSKSSNLKANLMNTLNKLIDKDPTREMMQLIESENEKACKHEMEIMEKLIQLTAPNH